MRAPAIVFLNNILPVQIYAQQNTQKLPMLYLKISKRNANSNRPTYFPNIYSLIRCQTSISITIDSKISRSQKISFSAKKEVHRNFTEHIKAH